MKKILLNLIILLSMAGYSQQRLIDAKKINVRELLYSNGYDLIYPGDSTGQFDYDNVEDPVLDLDAVNLRTLRRWFATYLDTVIVGLDTFVTLPPDTFLNAYGNSWLHSGQTIEHPPLDTFYVEWMQEWIGCNETIARDVDSIYIDSLNITICEGCFITTDTTQFYVRRNPCTYECWQYSYDNFQLHVVDWFCEPTPERNVYVTENSEDVLRYFNRDSYIDNNDSVGFARKTRYEDKYLRFSWDSVYWDEIKNDSLFMDGVWYNLPDTLPINVDSLIYVNNNPISIGDTIFTHDSIYYNGEWVLNDTIHIIDNSITNELDSIFYDSDWLKNGDTLTVPSIPSLYYIINDVPYFNQSTIRIDSSKWVYDTYGIHNKDYLMSTVGIGFVSQNWVRLYVDGLGETKGAIYAHSVGDWAITGSSDTGGGVRGIGDRFGVSGESINGTGGVFASDSSLGIRADSKNHFSAYFSSPLGMVANKINVGDPVNVLYSFPVADGDSLETIFTDGHGNLTFGKSGFYLLPDSVWKTGGDTVNIYWDRYTDIYFNNIYTNDEVAIGVESCGGSKLKVVGNDIYPTIQAVQEGTGYSGQFTGGAGLRADSINTPKINISAGLTVGDSTVTTIRSGATFTIWQGTQAAYDAIGTKDKKTIYYVEQNFNVLQILFFLLMFFGSRGVFGQSNWAAVNIGTTEMKKIYVGDKLVWEKKPDSTLICGKYYHFITIGTQIWLAENLHCDDSGGGIYSYNNDTEISDEYGYLYTWSAAMRIDTLITGWHLPTKTEYETLITYLGGSGVAGGKMKETGTDHWNSPNTGATNESRFTAFGGGRYNTQLKTFGYFLTSSKNPSTLEPYFLTLLYNNAGIVFNSSSDNTMSVRLIKD
jgi:uncharacterized protein (TIGR02145 family)